MTIFDAIDRFAIDASNFCKASLAQFFRRTQFEQAISKYFAHVFNIALEGCFSCFACG